MQYLLDTHVLIWFMEGDERLPLNLRYKIADPFDRIIIAQSISEKLPLLSIDKQFSKYPVHLIWD